MAPATRRFTRTGPKRRLRLAVLALAGVTLLVSCGGGGSDFESAPAAAPVITPSCPTCAANPDNLTVTDVQIIIAQAVGEAQAEHVKATVAISDRVGNVLAIFQMNGAGTSFTITDGRPVTGGLDNQTLTPATLAAVSEATTGAYLSSDGNAFRRARPARSSRRISTREKTPSRAGRFLASSSRSCRARTCCREQGPRARTSRLWACRRPPEGCPSTRAGYSWAASA